MKKFLIQTILLLIVIAGALYLYQSKTSLPNLPFLPEAPVIKEIRINNATIKAEIADTQAKRNKGLGGRQPLASDEGMLFLFPKIDKYPFWMKGLSFPLDFIWIRGDKVIEILPNIQPPAPGQQDSSLPIYQSSEPVDKVLEVPGGTTERLNIKTGDTVNIR